MTASSLFFYLTFNSELVRKIQICASNPSHKDALLQLCDNLGGWDGEGDGKDVQERGDRYTYGWFMFMFGRNQHNTVKQLSFN